MNHLIKYKYWIIGVLGLVGLVFYASLLKTTYEESSAQNLSVIDMDEEALLMKRKTEIMKSSYNHMMVFGEELREEGDLKMAAKRYFDAKSIFPTSVKPRYELLKVYFELAMQNAYYCYEAQKEINYAKNYITSIEHPAMYDDILKKEKILNKYCGLPDKYAFYYDQ